MPILPLIPSRWYGAQPGGELRVSLPPSAVVQRMRAELDQLHAWHGGGVTFGRKPFLGEFVRGTFRIRALSNRRDGATTFLVGEVVPCENGTLIRYRVESPEGFVRSLPFAGIAPVVLFAVGAYFAAPTVSSGSPGAMVLLVAAGAGAGLLCAVVLVALVLWGIRRDTRRLISLASFGFLKEDPGRDRVPASAAQP